MDTRWWNVSLRERKPHRSELISMVELARFPKDEDPKEPWRPGYKGGAGRCVWGGESRRTGLKAVWGGAGPADLLRHPSGPLLSWQSSANGLHQVMITWHSRALLSLRHRWIISNSQVLSIQKRKGQKNTNRRKMFRAGVLQEMMHRMVSL